MSKITRKVCIWTEDENGTWHTSCGEDYEIIEGTPIENGMQYCCYCGRHLEQEAIRNMEK